VKIAALIFCLGGVALAQDHGVSRHPAAPNLTLRYLLEQPEPAATNGTMALPPDQILEEEEEDPGSAVPS
jgi:hypothetical protein